MTSLNSLRIVAFITQRAVIDRTYSGRFVPVTDPGDLGYQQM